MDIYEGDEVMITSGKLNSYYGHVVIIEHYQNKPAKAWVRTLDENNNPTCRRYNLSNLIKA
jgi:ribosomal protein L24